MTAQDPYDKVADLNTNDWQLCVAQFQTPLIEMWWQMNSTFSMYFVFFAHADLNPANVLIHNGRLSGFVDWEFAGWYPEHWEYTKACYICVQMTPLVGNDGKSISYTLMNWKWNGYFEIMLANWSYIHMSYCPQRCQFTTDRLLRSKVLALSFESRRACPNRPNLGQPKYDLADPRI